VAPVNINKENNIAGVKVDPAMARPKKARRCKLQNTFKRKLADEVRVNPRTPVGGDRQGSGNSATLGLTCC